MFLFGLKLALIPFVQMTQHANLAAMIEAARRTEAGFNLSMSKTGISTSELPAKNYITPTPLAVEMSHEKTNKDLDNLAQQIQQLTLNYANLSSALMANAPMPPRERTNNTNNNNREECTTYYPQQRNNRRPADVTCYACRKLEHYVRDCHT